MDLDPNTGEIIKINDIPTSENQWTGLKHDHKYYLAERFGKDKADEEFLKKFKVRTPFDALAYSAIKSKKVLGLGNNFTMNDLSEELNKSVINKFERKKKLLII